MNECALLLTAAPIGDSIVWPAVLLPSLGRELVFAPGSETACQVKRIDVLEQNDRSKSVTDQHQMNRIGT